MKFKLPATTIILTLLTFVISSYVAYSVHGSILSKVKILELNEYGGLTFEHLRNFELWRLITSQLVHVKPLHMLFNVISIFILGCFLEKIVGAYRFLVLWFAAGISGTLVSMLSMPAPYNVGTGASQAVMGIAGCGVLILLKKLNTTISFKIALGFSIAPALALDLIYVHYPKPGHLISFVVGLFLGVYFLQSRIKPKSRHARS